MKFIKSKYLIISIVVLMIVAFIGCGGTDNSQEQDINNTQGETILQSENNGEFTESEIHFIDTGNSDSILIKQGEKAVLIDGAENDDENLIVNYLKNNGVSTLSYIIATHPHADHIGALDSVINNTKVESLLVANGSAETKTYTDFINAAADKKLNPSVPLDGAKFELANNSYIQIYNTNGGSDANEQSLVTLYVNGNDKFLFMGDGGVETEREIVSMLPDVDVLKIGHHGSKGSTEESFLDKVNPEYAVITVGKDNKYGHPHQATMEKLKSKDIIVYRTDENGTIVFDSNGNGVSTSSSKGSYAYRDGKSTTTDTAENENKESNANSNTQNNSEGTNSNQGNNNLGSSSSQGSTSDGGSNTSGSQGSTSSGGSNSGSNQGSTNGGGSNSSSGQGSSDNGGSGSNGNQGSGEIVYWTPNGKSYHSTKNCPTLSRSTTILSGTLSESGKTDPCDKCH